VLTRGDAPAGAAGNEHHPYRRDGRFVLPATSIKGAMRGRAGFILRSLGVIDEDACCATEGCGAVDCPMCFLFGSTDRRGRLRIADAILETSRTVTRTHVAIDRISGGASEHRLFTEKDIPFRPQMVLMLSNLGDGATTPDWVVSLLCAVLLDLHDGYVTLGSRGTTGLGHLTLTGDDADRFRAHLAAHSLVEQVRAWRSAMIAQESPT
jgi:CRISPR/Cas system CSM-associated protein Csm3 (group 7 of RAMP superfamily)